MINIRGLILAVGPISLFYLLCCYDGNLQSADSIYYHNIASNVFHKGLYIGPGGLPIIYWPPVYSLILIPSIFFDQFTIILHFCLLIGHQLLWVGITKNFFGERLNSDLTLSILGLNTLILLCSVYIWSEMLFMFLVTLTIYSSLNFYKKRDYAFLYLSALSLFLALLTRNAGVFFIPGFLLTGLFCFKGKDKYSFFLMIAIGVSGNLVWNFQRLFLMDHLHVVGELFPEFSVLENVRRTMDELLANFFPGGGYRSSWFLFPVFGALMFLVKRNVKELTFQECFLGLLLVSYLFIWFFIPADKDNLGRFLAPIFPLFLILLQTHLSRVLVTGKARLILVSVNLYIIIFSLARMIVNAQIWSNLL